MGCIRSKEVSKNRTAEIANEIVARNEIDIQELVNIQKNIDFNKKTSYWNIVHREANINLNNNKTIEIIKKLGI
jgi:hypothetical protein